jgi:hypothetical protein
MAGYDSVRVSKLNDSEREGYDIQFEVIGGYEDFLDIMEVAK